MPFLEILTRHYTKRPNMLAANQASLATQTDADWVQTLLVDDVGRGVAWANANLGTVASRLVGDYIWILDDDDLCTCPTLVEELKQIVVLVAPDVIFLRMDHGPLGVLPSDQDWRKAPRWGGIGMSAFVVRRAIWQQHAHAWREVYEADYRFIDDVWQGQHHVYWHDIVASRITRRSVGRPENA